MVLRKLQWLEAKLALPQFSKLAELTQSAPTAKQFNWLYAGNNALRSGSQQARDLALQGLSLPRRHLTI